MPGAREQHYQVVTQARAALILTFSTLTSVLSQRERRQKLSPPLGERWREGWREKERTPPLPIA
jgi:hypothetical protein